MRILYMVERFWPYIGGVEVISARLVTALRDRGHEVVVVTSRDDPRLPEHAVYDGIEVHRLPFVDAILTRDIDRVVEGRRRVGEITRELRPDLLHVIFTGPSVFYVPRGAAAGGAALVLCFHGSWPSLDLAPNGVLARLLDTADWITACSAHALEDLRGLRDGVAARSSVLHNGLAGPAGEPAPPPPGPPLVLCSGRMVHDKGFDVALDALALVREQVPGVRMLLAGDGPERPALEAQVARLGLGACVDVCGWVSPEAVDDRLAGTTLVVVPSRQEPFGLVALEAALMARPVVASGVGGLREVVRDGETGTLVPPEDPAALARGMLALLSNPDKARNLGRHARQRALRDFSATRYVDEHEALYARLVTPGAARGR